MGGLEDQVEENVEKPLHKIIEIMRKRNVEDIYSGALNTYNKSSCYYIREKVGRKGNAYLNNRK